jgi:uncharacterized membrane protein
MKIHFKKAQIPYLILLLFGALIFFMGFMNHYFFRSFVFDYGNYNFAFWDYSHFRISSMPTYPGNFLQDHYSFLLMYFVPVYWLLNWLTGTYTLIIIQNALILIAAWYTYKLIKLKTENLWLGVGVLIYYFVLLGRYSTFACDANLAVMSACFIPVFLYYFERRKFLISSIILILSLLSRENIPIWFIFIFIVLLIQHRKEKKAVIFSISGITLSVLYLILLFNVLIPAVESDEKQFTLFNYAALGASPGEALSFVLQNPIETLKMFFINHLDKPEFNGIKTEFYMVYMISGGIVLLFRPQYLIWFIPIVAQKVLNDAPIRWGILTYYSIEVVTLLPLSVFLTLAPLRSRKLQNGLTIAICAAALSMTLYKMNRNNRVEPNRFRPEKEKFYYEGFYQSPYDLIETHKLLKLIPPQAKVSASENLFSHLAQRKHIYFFPTVNDAEYVIFSVFDNYFRLSHMENEWQRNKYLSDPDWEIIGEEFPVFLLKKQEIPGSFLTQQNKIEFKTDTLNCNFEIIDTVANQVLFDNGIFADSPNRLNSDRSRSGDHSLLLMKDNRYGKAIHFNDINDFSYITSTVWFYGKDKNATIAAKFGSRLYFYTNSVIDRDHSNWKKLELSFWVPQKGDNTDFVIHLGNGSKEDSLFFDDFQIIRRFK